MLKPTSSTQLATFLFVDSRWYEPHDAVQCRAHGSTFEFLFEFQIEFFSNFLFEFQVVSRIKPFDFRGSTVYNTYLFSIGCTKAPQCYIMCTLCVILTDYFINL
jgi:hypothetical protein